MWCTWRVPTALQILLAYDNYSRLMHLAYESWDFGMYLLKLQQGRIPCFAFRVKAQVQKNCNCQLFQEMQRAEFGLISLYISLVNWFWQFCQDCHGWVRLGIYQFQCEQRISWLKYEAQSIQVQRIYIAPGLRGIKCSGPPWYPLPEEVAGL